MAGVIEQEKERGEGWAQLGLADPVEVVASEELTWRMYGVTSTHPGRAALQAYYDEHPEVSPPRGW